jgi:UDP-glucose 4-epimerase
MKKTALVTGGAGFIGSHVTNELIKLGMKVIVIDDLSGGFRDNVNPKAVFIKGSVVDHKLINSVFKKYKINYVFHLAAYAAECLSHFIKRFNYNNNLIGSINLINESVNNNVECFVFTSSIAVYGKNQLPMTERLVPNPEDSYGISKLSVEKELAITHEMFGLNYIIFRPHNVYGENQNIGDKYRNVIGIFMNQIMKNEPMTIFGNGKQTRAFTYIKDIAPVMAKSVFNRKAFNQVFNIGSDKPYSLNELAKVVAEVMGVQCRIKRLEARNEVQHAYSSHAKLKKHFSYKPTYGLRTGVTIMAEWAKKTGSRASAKFKNIEIPKNLPASWR